MSCIRRIVSLVATVGLLGTAISDVSAQGFFGGGGGRNSNESRRMNNNSGNYSNNNSYYEQPATYYAPVAPAPAPASSAAATEVKPKQNEAPFLSDAKSQAMIAALNVRQAKEATKAGGRINAGMEQYFTQGAVDARFPDLRQAQKEWSVAIRSGDLNEFKKFLLDFGSKLPAEQQKWLDTRITVLQYEQDLSSGFLTQAGKDARLEQMRKSVALWPASATKNGVQAALAEIGKLNDLSSLAELSKGAGNAFQVMFNGFQNAGFTADDMSDATGLPIMATAAVEDSTVAVAKVLIMNPEENGQAVNYNIGTYAYTMNPGEKQSLTQSYAISFDPGDGTSVKKITVESGVYHFVLGPSAWGLKKVTPKIKIDNGRNDGTFHYLLGGKETSLQPGQVAEHADPSALVIEFDRGDGSSQARKVLATGSYVVGIDPAKQCLELFDSKSGSPAALLSSNGSSAGNSAPKDARSRQRQIEEALTRLKASGN